jgi:hypothetical protein
MKKSTFIAMVQKELDNIKEKATPKELKRLVFKDFNPASGFGCVYGLLTGVWHTKRAKEFQKKFFQHLHGFGGNSFDCHNLDKKVAGTTGYTALEKYILMVKPSKNREIFQYLKGKRETIDLNVI